MKTEHIIKITQIKEVFFAFFPGINWIGLFIAIFLRFVENKLLSNLLINLLIIFAFLNISLILHEAGHLVFAKLAGGNPRRLILGNGHEIIRFEIFKIKIIINTRLYTGYALSTYKSNKYIKFKSFVSSSGGFITNLLLAYLMYMLSGFATDFFSGKHIIDLSGAFIYANLVSGIISIFPYKFNYFGVKIPSDGLNLIYIFSKSAGKNIENLDTNTFLDAYDHFEKKEYDKAIEIYNSILEKDSSSIGVNIDLSVMYLKKGEYDKALKILNDIESKLDTKENESFKALAFNNFAWLCLIKRDIEKADEYSSKAIKLNSKEKCFQGTRGSVLVEKGEVDEGMNYLIPLRDFKFANSLTLPSAIYMAYGYHQKNKLKEKAIYLEFVEKNIDKLDVDEKYLFNIIMNKIKEPVIGQIH